MPCVYYSDDEHRRMARADFDRVTCLLCKMIAHFGVIPGDYELAAWKADHDAMDRRRIEAEEWARKRKEEEERRKQVAAQAREKLTPEELEALKREK